MKMPNGIPQRYQNCLNCARYNLPEEVVMGFSYNGCAEKFKHLPKEKIRTFRCGNYREDTLSESDY